MEETARIADSVARAKPESERIDGMVLNLDHCAHLLQPQMSITGVIK
jgi:hypothetical protein